MPQQTMQPNFWSTVLKCYDTPEKTGCGIDTLIFSAHVVAAGLRAIPPFFTVWLLITDLSWLLQKTD